MRFIWMGAEVPNDVDLLYGAGVRDMGVSLSSFKKRTGKQHIHVSLERFADDVRLYLYDTAAYNTESSQEELLAAAQTYEDFLHNWYTKFHAFTEFDAPTVGKPEILSRRDDFYDQDRFENVFWPSWHSSYGLDHLKYLGESYTNVVVPVSYLKDKQVLTLISALKTEYQTAFHCNGFTMDQGARHELFDTIFMSTWSSALRHGDLYVPYGQRWIRRLPKDEQKAALAQNGDFIESLGCDPQMLLDGSTSEREIYTVRLFRWLETGRSSILDVLSESSDESASTVSRGFLLEVTDSGALETGRNGNGNHLGRYPNIDTSDYRIPSPVHDPITVLPGTALDSTPVFQPDGDGHMVLAEIPLVRHSHEPIRQCNTCVLAANCPAHTEGAMCKFKMPVQIRTREQMQALTEAMLELQASRVFFASFAEETTGYHDPTVGKEMDRFAKLASMFAKMGESKETLKLEASRTTQGGVLSQIFGPRASRPEVSGPPGP